MKQRKQLRRLSVLVTAQTLYPLERLADMDGHRQLGRVVDKLVREKMLALRRTGAPCEGRSPGKEWGA